MSLIGNIVTIVLIVLLVMTAVTEPKLSLEYGNALITSSFKACKWVYDFFKNGDYGDKENEKDNEH